MTADELRARGRERFPELAELRPSPLERWELGSLVPENDVGGAGHRAGAPRDPRSARDLGELAELRRHGEAVDFLAYSSFPPLPERSERERAGRGLTEIVETPQVSDATSGTPSPAPPRVPRGGRKSTTSGVRRHQDDKATQTENRPPPSIQLWVKRDDLLGEGGTKIRKLRVELARAARDRASLLTFGPLDSNHALATAHAAAVAGLPLRLSIVGDPAADPARAERLSAAAPTGFHGNAPSAALSAALWLARGAIARERRRLLPPGGTTVASTAAVALAVAEAVEQFQALGVPVPSRWAVAVGTGGTLAGLVAGVNALDLPVEVTGVLASSRVVRPSFVAWLANRALRKLAVSSRIRPGHVQLDTSQLGGGHGVPTPASSSVLRDFASLGHPLDPVFTSKALAGLLERFEAGDRWLFWHTGVSV